MTAKKTLRVLLLLLFLLMLLSALPVGEADNFPTAEDGDPKYQMIDIAEARDKGIMPITFQAASR